MKSAGKARNNGLYRHIRTSKEIIRNLLNDYNKYAEKRTSQDIIGHHRTSFEHLFRVRLTFRRFLFMMRTDEHMFYFETKGS